MPEPTHVKVGRGKLVIDNSFSIGLDGYQEPRLVKGAARLIKTLSRETGIPLSDLPATDASKASLVIHVDHAGEAVQSVREDESYQLEVTPQQAKLTAPTPVGALRGMQTLLQLAEVSGDDISAPAVQIQDMPRFPWRGLMIDACRHWMPVEVIKRNLDGMEAVKLNVLHWHLSENQGFRIESKIFPKLQEMGSDGHFYTQEQVKDVIAYARDRGIRVYPEFDMPGHSTAWFVGYPELASAPGPYTVERHWGVFDPAMDPTRDETYQFLDKLIGEMAALFPDEYFHIGGDEVNGKAWQSSPRIVAFMKDHGMKTADELQAYFNQRLIPLVLNHGKKVIGWDEVLQPGVQKDIMIQSWRGQKSLADAAQQGYMGILSAGYYLDLMYPASRHYLVDPMEGATGDLAPEEKSRILGGEACMWSEFVSTENVDSRIWPRMAAIAERFWSPQNVRDVGSMYARLAVESHRLEFVGLTHRSSYAQMLGRLGDFRDLEGLKTLAGVVEPMKEYARGQSREYTSFTPLNRLVDAARPESDTAREFAAMADNWRANEGELRKTLRVWSASANNLVPAMRQSSLLQEDVPLAENLSAVGSAGLEALDYLDSGKPAPDSWAKDKTAILDRAWRPHAELLLMAVPPVRKLVEAAAGRAAQ
ncbi:MAG: beta-N-acetylhexosaminidase [Deltaproteobacteria bacterium]